MHRRRGPIGSSSQVPHPLTTNPTKSTKLNPKSFLLGIYCSSSCTFAIFFGISMHRRLGPIGSSPQVSHPLTTNPTKFTKLNPKSFLPFLPRYILFLAAMFAIFFGISMHRRRLVLLVRRHRFVPHPLTTNLTKSTKLNPKSFVLGIYCSSTWCHVCDLFWNFDISMHRRLGPISSSP